MNKKLLTGLFFIIVISVIFSLSFALIVSGFIAISNGSRGEGSFMLFIGLAIMSGIMYIIFD